MRKIVSLLIFLFLTLSSDAASIDDKLKALPIDDKIKMRKFFDCSLCLRHIGHVIFFDSKPVALVSFVLKGSRPYIELMNQKGWMCFKKHEILFPHPRFIIQDRIIEFDKNYKVCDIYFINKKALKICLEEYHDTFFSFLGESFTPETFISQLEEGENLSSLVLENDTLLGILLGYGKDSAQAYKLAQEDYSSQVCPTETEHYCGIAIPKPKGCKIFPVAFMGDPHSKEVQRLATIYEKELEEIWALYRQSDDSLKLVLEALCKE